jgi:hypothetical protein
MHKRPCESMVFCLHIVHTAGFEESEWYTRIRNTVKDCLSRTTGSRKRDEIRVRRTKVESVVVTEPYGGGHVLKNIECTAFDVF